LTSHVESAISVVSSYKMLEVDLSRWKCNFSSLFL